jgi:hypothetical protein
LALIMSTLHRRLPNSQWGDQSTGRELDEPRVSFLDALAVVCGIAAANAVEKGPGARAVANSCCTGYAWVRGWLTVLECGFAVRRCGAY